MKSCGNRNRAIPTPAMINDLGSRLRSSAPDGSIEGFAQGVQYQLHSVEGDEQYEGQSKAECCPYLRQVAATVGQMSQYAAAEPRYRLFPAGVRQRMKSGVYHHFPS